MPNHLNHIPQSDRDEPEPAPGSPAHLPRSPKTAADQLTVREYLDRWLSGRETLRPSTRLAYEIHIRRYLTPYLGQIPLGELTVDDVEAMYRAIETGRCADEGTIASLALSPGRLPVGRPLSAATIRRIHATLTSSLNAAVRRGLIMNNPTAYAELRRAPRPEMSAWNAEQLSRFLSAASGHRLHTLFMTLAVTGLRRGEALGLRWIDVDLDGHTLRVRQQLLLIGDGVQFGESKSASGRRTVALPHILVNALRMHAANQRAVRRAIDTRSGNAGLVFTTSDGEALSPARVSREFGRLVNQCDVPPIRLHDLRHTSASVGLASGESLLEVSRRLGHSSITITADVYSHIAPTTARASADRLVQLIASAEPRAEPTT